MGIILQMGIYPSEGNYGCSTFQPQISFLQTGILSSHSDGNLLKRWSIGSFQESVLDKIFNMEVPLLVKGRDENTLTCQLVCDSKDKQLLLQKVWPKSLLKLLGVCRCHRNVVCSLMHYAEAVIERLAFKFFVLLIW